VRAGRLYCWGYNASGQLGDGTTTKRNVPTLVSGGFTDWSSVSVGVEHTCGLRAGMLYCWGKNTYGRLGDSTTMARHVPTPVSGGFADWQSVSAGDLHTCGVRAGQMYCWGYNNDGQLGDSTTTERDVPTPVSGGFTDWASVSTGGAHSCGKRVALTYQGHLYCWGSNTYGQLGDGTTMERDVPTPVSGGLTDEWQSVSAGGSHTCGANADQLYCWGNNASGRLGDGTTTERDVPTLVIGDFVDWWPSVSAGDHSCGVHGDPGLLYCWGGNESGELGNGTTAVGPTSAPQPIVRP
jgi:alpha-tubulin suppressor-like RCC1 family protein